VILDEGHFAPEKTVQTLLGLVNQGARFLLVSTPPVGTSNVQGIIDGCVDGKPICTRVRLDFNCTACLKIQETVPSHQCLHNTHLRNRSTSVADVAKGMAAYSSADAGARELYGSALKPRNRLIDADAIKRLRETPRTPCDTLVPPKHVFVSIDPSGSTRRGNDVANKSNTSEYAIVSVFVCRGVHYVNVYFLFSILRSILQPLLDGECDEELCCRDLAGYVLPQIGRALRCNLIAERIEMHGIDPKLGVHVPAERGRDLEHVDDEG